MAKLIALGIAVFFIGGLILEGITNNIMNHEADANTLSTADRYITAHKENKIIPANPPPDLPTVVEDMTLKDCRAENLNPYTETPVTGTVTRIIDGDTLRINIEGVEMPVRLWGIDAPEMTQRNGPEAKEWLEMMVPEGSRTTIHPVNRDRYGRIVAVVDNRHRGSCELHDGSPRMGVPSPAIRPTRQRMSRPRGTSRSGQPDGSMGGQRERG